MDADNAWERLFYKHSPSKMIDLSPIRMTSRLVGTNGILNEDIVKGYLWTLLNTEEFYFQNSSSLVHHHFNDPRKLSLALNDNINVIRWDERLINYRFIGEGVFGEVYQATDKVTKERYALKGIKPGDIDGDNDDEVHATLYEFLSYLLQERNIFAELNTSPFFVRMLAAFQSSDMSRFWFVMEFCMCNIQNLLSLYPVYSSPEDLVDDYFEGSSISKVTDFMNDFLGLDYLHVVFIYLFEMLSSLHYLATHHVVHADIKLANLLIDQEGHLKLSDFGVSFRNQWFDRSSIALLPGNISEMTEAENKDEKPKKDGTVDYYDPEILIEEFKTSEPESYADLQKRFDGSENFRNITDTHQNFMSDLYAVGVATFELITGGIMFTNTSISPFDHTYFWSIEIIYDETVRQSHLIDKVKALSDNDDILSVLEFLLTVFSPRAIRSKDYIKDIIVFQQKKRTLAQFIDIGKVENIPYYKSRSITKESVLNIIFAESFLDKLYDEFAPRGKKIKNASELNLGNKKRVFNLHPFDYSLSIK